MFGQHPDIGRLTLSSTSVSMSWVQSFPGQSAVLAQIHLLSSDYSPALCPQDDCENAVEADALTYDMFETPESSDQLLCWEGRRSLTVPLLHLFHFLNLSEHRIMKKLAVACLEGQAGNPAMAGRDRSGQKHLGHALGGSRASWEGGGRAQLHPL